ncbi:hypothetical protein C2857_006144 [Epichloe festucae Fl1]|uniref:NIMA interactive protein n=1 Tax=Epichloe festucae (strain Fl1) TaxID=877507 RepID=A0A7S9KPX0_EPIFF|nr:hypothetical protein C2857_006144 [Epichloe festucae Fl1]
MIDTDNLRTASLYINNQLLSRGLLRDGDYIDFAGTRRSEEEDAEVSGRIISVLNDLILRRDRDAEHRESLSTSMRAMRAENLKLIADLTRSNDKYTEAQRRADLATRAESALKTQLKSAEANARALKEEVARMRTLVAQSRSCCATEIRRRDRQIDTLKRQLGEAGRSRGTRANPALTTITVTGDIGNEKDNTTTISNSSHYDSELRSETNTTLANLARHLTEENDIMLGVMQQTMAQLRDMSGWVADTKEDEEVRKRPTCEEMAAELDSILDHMRTILTNPSFVPIEEVVTREEEINRLKTGWVKMETRWKDAVHLMDGWRKRMASSGKPVCDEDLQMGMRLSPVRIKDLDETRVAVADHGLSAVKEEPEENEAHEFLRSPCPRHAAEEPDYAADEDFDDVGGDSDSDAANHEDHVSEDEYPVADGSQGMFNRPDQESMHEQEQDESLESAALAGRPQPSPLVNSSSAGNRGFLRNEKLRFGPSHHGSNGDEGAPTSESKSMRSQPVRPRALASQSRLPSRVHRPAERPRSPSRTSLDDALLPTKRDVGDVEMPPAPAPPGNDEHDDPVQAADEIDETQNQTCTTLTTHSSPTRVESRTKPPRDMEPKPAQSPLTMSNIAAKLAASEREADAARVRAKLKAARGSTRGVSRPIVSTSAATATVEVEVEAPPDEELASRTRREQQGTARDPVKQDPGPSDSLAKPEKRKRDRKVGKTTSRRRSTLSPMELKALISGEAL